MVLRSALLACAFGLAAASPAHAGWSKAYAVEWFEPAMFFGSDTLSAAAPGSDCPGGINPDVDFKRLLIQAGYPEADLDEVLKPEGKLAANKRKWITYRGLNKEDIYKNPWAAPDPGMIEVTGTVAEGFDLDGDAATGFTSPDGKVRGIDNNYYRMGGCTLRWRGRPKDAFQPKYANDGMRDGRHTMVILLSGESDPRNDADARLAFYTSKDKLVKDANGAIARDFTFRIDPDPRFQAIVPVRVKDGVIESQMPADLIIHDYKNSRGSASQLTLFHNRLRFTIAADGTLHGLLGGYTPWRQLLDDSRDFILEETGHFDVTALAYALQRNADGMPGADGKMTAISSAFRMDAVPAYLVTPKADAQVTAARLYPPEPARVADAR